MTPAAFLEMHGAIARADGVHVRARENGEDWRLTLVRIPQTREASRASSAEIGRRRNG